MWYCSDHTRTLWVASQLAHLTRKTSKARKSLPQLSPLPLEQLEPRLLLSIGPSNVLIIYNQDWAGDQDANGVQDSLEVAQYYAQVHGVPAQKLLGIHCR